MGVCATCTRRGGNSNTLGTDRPAEMHVKLCEYFEKNRKPVYWSDQPENLQKASKFSRVVNSASNYWNNDHEGPWDTHRTAVTYRMENMNQLLRVQNSIITENVLFAVLSYVNSSTRNIRLLRRSKSCINNTESDELKNIKQALPEKTSISSIWKC